MKPEFALSLSNEGAELLRRSAGGWLTVGSVDFDRPDRDAALDALRSEALRLSPDGFTTKLIVPPSEIRYASVLAPGPTDEARRYQIEAEIEGLTPYPVEELAYDWSVEGDTALVAVVARETLIEVEGFAAERGFNPVCFVAMPEPGSFGGEPFFGQTGLARQLLPAGTTLQPDSEPVRRIARSAAERPAEPTPTPPAKAARPAPARPADPAPAAPEPETEAGTAPGDGLSRVGSLVRRMGTRLRREQAASRAEEPVRAIPPATVAHPAGGAAVARAQAVDPEARPDEAQAALPQARPEPEPEPAPPEAARAAGAQPGPDEGSAAVISFSSRRNASRGTATEDRPPKRSKRDRAAKPGEPSPATETPESVRPGGRLAITHRPGSGRKGGTLKQLIRSGRGLTRRSLASVGLLEAVRRLRGRGNPTSEAEAGPGPGASTAADALAAPVGATPAPSSAQGPVGSAATAYRPPQTAHDRASEAKALTLFGRRGQPDPSPLLPVRAMLAIGAVVVLLIAVAGWALFLNRADTPPPALAEVEPVEPAPIAAPDPLPAPPAAVAADPAAAPAAEPLAEPAPDPASPLAAEPEIAAAPPVPVPAPDTAPAPADQAAAPAADADSLLEELVRDALAEPAPADVLDSLAAPAGEPITGPAESGADVAGSADSAAEALPADEAPPVPSAASARLVLPTRLEVPPVDERAPVALPPPPPAAQILAGAAAPLPVEPGTEPEPEIAVTQGRPAVVPTGRPARIGPPAPALAPPEAEAPPVVEPVADPVAEPVAEPAPEAEAAPVLADDTPRADPALAGARPEARSPRVRALGEALRAAQPEPDAEPEALPEPAERLDQGSLGASIVPLALAAPGPAAETGDEPAAAAAEVTPGGVDLALLRPQRRPTDLVPVPEPEPEAVAEDETASEAVARSPLPSARPASLNARVTAALDAERRRTAAAAARPPAPAAAAPAPAAAAAATAPSIPSSASVQREATERRGINTRQANLIGVFGTPSNRRALVRMPNGSVVRLQVGDSFDGGRVSAIGETELRYVAGGRDRVLRLAGRG